jgi:hypothetical protein
VSGFPLTKNAWNTVNIARSFPILSPERIG